MYGAKPPRPERSERLKSVDVSTDKMFIIYQRVVIAVTAAPVFFVEARLDIALAIIVVIFFGNLNPQTAVISPEVEPARMVLPPLHKSLSERADIPWGISLDGVKGDNLSVNSGAGSQPIFVTVLCMVSREAFAHESRGEGSTGGITPELYDSISFVTLHFFYAAPTFHYIKR